MTELGKSVYDAFNFLNGFLVDVSRVVKHVEEKMTNSQLVPLGDASCILESSKAYYAPEKWMPKYIVRQYAPERKKGMNWYVKWFVFFIIYLAPETLKEPVVVWGIAKQTKNENMYKLLNSIGLYKSDPDFLNAATNTSWQSLAKQPKDMAVFKYQSKPLVEINDSQTIDEIVHSLLDATKNL